AQHTPDTATIDIPGWMWGGQAEGLFQHAGLRARRDASTGRWRIRTIENELQRRPSLFECDHLIGPAAPRPMIEKASEIAAQGHWPNVPVRHFGELVKYRETAENSGNPVDLLVYLQLTLMVSPPKDLSRAISAAYQVVQDIGLEGDPSAKVFADTGVHLVRRAHELVTRVKLCSVLLRIQNDPALNSGTLSHVRAAHAAGNPVFSS